MANKRNGVLYIGVTANLIKRVFEHKSNLVEGFTQKYNVHTLIYYEVYGNVEDAIKREKNMKKWKRNWKIKLINKKNPQWEDLYPEVTR